ncbi:MAG: serine/threonine protein kinase [Sandaracinaceae bacterium]|nr:serine/threonine protein kinase [Sandaracinaceae bacterium]
MRHVSIQADPLSKHASAEERVWASARLGNAALLMAGLFGAWWLLITAVITVNAPPELRQWRFGTLEHWVDVVLAASFVVFGLALRFGRPTRPSLLLGADFVYAVGACLGAAWHGWSWSLTQPPLQSYILIATYALVLRAALLPGPPKRTLMVGFIGWTVGAGLVGTLDLGLEAPPGVPTPTIGMVVGAVVIWGGVTVGLTGALSQILHGLRRKAQAAEQLGQYVIESKIAEGGMGVVYRARHVLLRRATALKLLKPELSDPVSVARFEREVRLTSQLRHPNTIAVHDFGQTPEGVFYFAMELLEGLDLQTLVDRQGPLTAPRALYIFRQAASALVEAHEAGLIHRDVKPSNLYISSAGPVKDWVKVLDFGLVRKTDAKATNLSVAGALVGTPLYMSPEQITHPDDIDARSDLYALGCTLYFALTGTPVFDGESIVEVCASHLRDEPVPVSVRNPDVPLPVERLVRSLLEKDPAERRQTAEEVVDAIDRLLDQLPWTARDSVKAWERHAELYKPVEATDSSRPSGLTVDLGARPDLGSTVR